MEKEESLPFELYGFYRSSCSGRLRLALNLKGVKYAYKSVDTKNGQQRTSMYKKLNPAGTVPVLIDHRPGFDGASFPITQSVAALEYLEETLPVSFPLLPPASQPLQRAKVRTLVEIVCDFQPVANRRVAKAVAELGYSFESWMKEQSARGLRSFEGTVSETAGKYSVGDVLSLADVCLIPSIWNAKQWGVDLSEFPTIMRIFNEASKHSEVQKAHWSVQPDTPADLAFD